MNFYLDLAALFAFISVQEAELTKIDVQNTSSHLCDPRGT